MKKKEKSSSSSSYRHYRHERRRSRRSRSRSRSTSRRRKYHRNEEDEDEEDHHKRYYQRSRSGSRHHHRHSKYEDHHDEDIIDRKIYIGDLMDVSRQLLDDTFSKFGQIAHIKLIEGKDYGFITFKHGSSAKEAIEEMNGAVVGSGKIKVNRAKMVERQHRSVPWVDEDGRLSDMLDTVKAASQFHAYEQPPIQRTLTNYDDLL
ncbi:hypothetical protein BJ944DRAFT_259248 [Cunninghamella echinulata]|nr:hypothetical protein BJ944DRAFT_259248 [Cunninghamella echinulata]